MTAHESALSHYIEAVVFDYDGTLADTIGTHSRARELAFERTANETGDGRYVTVPSALHEQAHFHGVHPQEIIGWIMVQAGIVETIYDERVTRMVTLIKQIYKELAATGLPEISGASDFVRYAFERWAGKIAIATTAHRADVLPYLNRYNIRHLFAEDCIVTAEDIAVTKPAPDVYLEAFKRMGITEPQGVLSIEDVRQGVEAANAAGAASVAIATTHSVTELEQYAGSQKPLLIVQDFAELQMLLKQEAQV